MKWNHSVVIGRNERIDDAKRMIPSVYKIDFQNLQIDLFPSFSISLSSEFIVNLHVHCRLLEIKYLLVTN